MNANNSKLYFAENLFLLGIIAKQFYILPSGLPQIGDILILASFLLFWMSGFQKETNGEESTLQLFVILVVIVNGIHMLLYPSVEFLLPVFYYIFNYFVVLLTKSLMRFEGFSSKLEWVIKIDLIIQGIIYLSGRGRWYYGVRYMGSFNDPNQYAFFIFGAMLVLCLLGKINNKLKENIFWYFLAFYLMLPAASTGMLAGFCVFWVLFIGMRTKSGRGKIIGVVIVIMIAVFILSKIADGTIVLPASVSESFIVQRLLYKINGLGSSSKQLTEDRQWGILLKYPLYIFVGAGEGSFIRFGIASEIHSSILAPLWYYGLIPFSVWITWCKRKIQKVDPSVWCVYFALIIESITLVNNRQPFFWMIFILADYCLARRYFVMDNGEKPYENVIHT